MRFHNMSLRINRYIVGCKFDINRLITTNINELIDTQWDVNYQDRLYILQTILELIDTQWDVNEDEEELYKEADSN